MKNVWWVLLCAIMFIRCKEDAPVAGAKACQEVLQIPGWQSNVFCQTEVDIRNSISFPTLRIGYLGGLRGGVLKTTDGGQSWQQLSVPTTLHISGLSFLTADVGFVTGQAMGPCLDQDCDKGVVMLKTTDGGSTWEKWFPGNQLGHLENIHFYDQLTGISVSHTGSVAKSELVRTTDGGKTWQPMGAPLDYMYGGKMLVLPSGTAIIPGKEGKLLKIKSQGTSWETLQSPLYQIRDFSFVSESSGFVMGILANGQNQIWQTTNGGQTWTEIKGVSGDRIYFVTEQEGFVIKNVCSYKGGDFPTCEVTAFSTTNGGKTWQSGNTLAGGLGYFYSISPRKGFFLRGNTIFTVQQ